MQRGFHTKLGWVVCQSLSSWGVQLQQGCGRKRVGCVLICAPLPHRSAAAGKAVVYMNSTEGSEPVVLPPEYVNGLDVPAAALDALTDQQRGACTRGCVSSHVSS